MKKKYILIFIFTFVSYVSLTPSLSHALTMKGTNYIIEMGNLNSGAGNASGANNKLGITVGQTAPGLYTGTNYKVRSGFQYIHSIIAFTFAINSREIDFGTLSATNPVTRKNTLTLSNGSANGYAVTAFENHQLNVPSSGAIIPDTSCDDGTCTTTTSAEWSSTLTYGFGYRCDAVSSPTQCASGFSTANYFKRFSTSSESAQTVMTGSNVGTNYQVDITYKVNISGTQPAGLYGNTITYVATPTF